MTTNLLTLIIVAFNGIVVGMLLLGWMFKLSPVRRYRTIVASFSILLLLLSCWRMCIDLTWGHILSSLIAAALVGIYVGRLDKYSGTITVRQ